MNAKDFPERIGRLVRDRIRRKGKEISEVTYRLLRSSGNTSKFSSVRDSVFTVKPLGTTQVMVSIGDEPFENTYTTADIPYLLLRAFDRECIRTGIVTASAKLKNSKPVLLCNIHNPTSLAPKTRCSKGYYGQYFIFMA